jgi:hypothetical protein
MRVGIAEIYRLERKLSALTSEERLASRRSDAKPLWTDLHEWLRLERGRVPDGSATAKALNYSLNHWEALTHNLLDGDVNVDNGAGEINVRNVSGSFTVESDGSGGIFASDVKGSVVVENDGSGEIEVTKIGKDFRVESKGSGNIDYADVTGQVDIPERHRDRRYRSGR